MEIILLERVEHLGQMGDVVKVKPGYARNFLLPQGKALRSSKENLAYFESQKAQLEVTNLKRRQEAEAVVSKMEGLSVTIIRQASEGGQLYGSVTGRDVADAIKEAGYTVERRQINLDVPIKVLGTTKVRVSLHPEVSVTVDVLVARSLDDAERMMAAAAASARKEAEKEVEKEVETVVAAEESVEAAEETVIETTEDKAE